MYASVLLLFTLLTAGFETSRACGKPEYTYGSFQYSHLCYECDGLGNYCPKKLVMCPSGISKCMSSTIVMDIGGIVLKKKKNGCSNNCQKGSMNFGLTKSSISCCDTNFCNAEDAPDPRFKAPNGRTCYYCDGQSCTNTVSCSGTEDSCITATVTNSGTPTLLKGCITKSFCGLLKCSFIQDLSCCEGNLCNGNKGLNQSAIQSFPYKTDTYRSLYEAAKKSDTYMSLYEGAKKSDTYRAMNEGAKSDTYRAMNEGAKSDTYRAMNEGAKSDTYRAMNEGAKSDTYRAMNEGAKSDTYRAMNEGAKSDTYRAMNEGAKSDTYRAINEGAKSDTYRAMNEGAKSDTYRAMNEGAKSDTYRAMNEGAKSDTYRAMNEGC
ncbi:uncharacterized protein LOC143745962 isoform X2 [Siphateles boraxobius]|uniref:uncharacterized protein LOC143745962 isoform X2 n=1 Tax=Siphateles boraxobius TaxID=180520 RepID=UPI0040646CEC